MPIWSQYTEHIYHAKFRRETPVRFLALPLSELLSYIGIPSRRISDFASLKLVSIRAHKGMIGDGVTPTAKVEGKGTDAKTTLRSHRYWVRAWIGRRGRLGASPALLRESTMNFSNSPTRELAACSSSPKLHACRPKLLEALA